MIECPICRTKSASVVGTEDYDSIKRYVCEVCGRFEIARMAERKVAAGDRDPRLSSWVRWQSLLGSPAPHITARNLDDISRALPTYSPAERQEELLRALAAASRTPGHRVEARSTKDFPLAWAEVPDEYSFYLLSLAEAGLIKIYSLRDGGEGLVELTIAGWTRAALGRSADSSKAFVAMSFAEEMAEVWLDGLRLGIERAGYTPHRVDSEPHIDRIDQKIIGDIKQSRFVVADVTGQRNGVYFEAGYALGLGKPVIWTVREDELPHVHFDTRQFAHIVWKSPEELAEKLRDVVLGVIGTGTRSLIVAGR